MPKKNVEKSQKSQKIRTPYLGVNNPSILKKNGILMNGHRGFGAIHNALSWFGRHLRVSSSRHIQIETGRWRPKSMARHGRGIAASTSLGQLNSSLSVALCTTRRVKKEEKTGDGRGCLRDHLPFIHIIRPLQRQSDGRLAFIDSQIRHPRCRLRRPQQKKTDWPLRIVRPADENSFKSRPFVIGK